MQANINWPLQRLFLTVILITILINNQLKGGGINYKQQEKTQPQNNPKGYNDSAQVG